MKSDRYEYLAGLGLEKGLGAMEVLINEDIDKLTEFEIQIVIGHLRNFANKVSADVEAAVELFGIICLIESYLHYPNQVALKSYIYTQLDMVLASMKRSVRVFVKLEGAKEDEEAQ